MKSLRVILAALTLSVAAVGCTSTGSVILEFDAAGRVIKETRTSESVLHTLVTSTKDKSVIMWEDSFIAYMSVSGGTIDNPTPHGKIFAGKTNKGFISIRQEQQGLSDIATIIQATKEDFRADLEGISSSKSP